MGYGTFALKSKSKTYLCKLLEFNKAAIADNHQFLKSNSPLEKLVTEFMFTEANTSDGGSDGLALKAQSDENIEKIANLNTLKTVSNLKIELDKVMIKFEESKIQIQQNQEECQSVILSIILYVESKAKELYRYCHKYGIIEQTKIALYARQMNSNFNAKSFGGSKGYQFYTHNDPINQLTVF